MSHDLNFLHVMASTFLIMAPFVLCMRCIWLPLTVWISVNNIGWTFQPTSSYYFFLSFNCLGASLPRGIHRSWDSASHHCAKWLLHSKSYSNHCDMVQIYSSLLICVLIFFIVTTVYWAFILEFPCCANSFCILCRIWQLYGT